MLIFRKSQLELWRLDELAGALDQVGLTSSIDAFGSDLSYRFFVNPGLRRMLSWPVIALFGAGVGFSIVQVVRQRRGQPVPALCGAGPGRRHGDSSRRPA